MPGKNKDYWIQKAELKPGALSRQLKIPEKENIPMRLLDKIISAKSGQTIRNTTGKGKRTIKVTRLLERRAIAAKKLKEFACKKRKNAKRKSCR